MTLLRKLLRLCGLYAMRDVETARDDGWTSGFIVGARGKGVVNERGRFRPAKHL